MENKVYIGKLTGESTCIIREDFIKESIYTINAYNGFVALGTATIAETMQKALKDGMKYKDFTIASLLKTLSNCETIKKEIEENYSDLLKIAIDSDRKSAETRKNTGAISILPDIESILNGTSVEKIEYIKKCVLNKLNGIFREKHSYEILQERLDIEDEYLNSDDEKFMDTIVDIHDNKLDYDRLETLSGENTPIKTSYLVSKFIEESNLVTYSDDGLNTFVEDNLDGILASILSADLYLTYFIMSQFVFAVKEQRQSKSNK